MVFRTLNTPAKTDFPILHTASYSLRKQTQRPQHHLQKHISCSKTNTTSTQSETQHRARRKTGFVLPTTSILTPLWKEFGRRGGTGLREIDFEMKRDEYSQLNFKRCRVLRSLSDLLKYQYFGPLTEPGGRGGEDLSKRTSPFSFWWQ